MAGALSHSGGGKPSLSTLFRSNPSRPFALNRPTIVAMAQDQSYWAKVEDDIEAHLKKNIPIRPPVTVFEPMHYLTFAAPKSTASALCIAACELVGGKRAQALDAASAIHLMHAAAYTHQHLPLTDRPKPKPTIPHKFEPNIELLTGDGIIPFGLEMLARSMDSAQNDSGRILRVIIEITRASGSQGMVEGYYREWEWSQSEEERANDMGLIEYISKKKEGELHSCGATCGAILGGGSEEEIEKLRRFGLYVGMVKGLLKNDVGRNKKEVEEMVEKFKGFATKELEGLKGRQIEVISSLFETNGVVATV